MSKEIDYKKQTDFVLGSELTDRGNSGPSRALVKGDGNKLILNFNNDFTGGVTVGSNTKVNGFVDAKGFTLNGAPLIGPKGDPGSLTENDKKYVLWCADGQLCQVPGTTGSGIRWGYGGSSIIDDGHLRIKTDDNIVFSAGNEELARISPSGFSVGKGMGPYFIRTGDGNSYLDSGQFGDGQRGSYVFQNNNHIHQQWIYEPFSKQLRSVQNDKCLSLRNNKMVLETCQPNDESQVVSITEDNRLRIGNRCYDKNSADRQWDCNGDHWNQKAIFRKI